MTFTEPGPPSPPGVLERILNALATLVTRRSSTHTSINEVVADVHGVERFRWILRNMAWFGLLVHVIFMLAFALVGVWSLAGFNVASVLTYVLALQRIRRGETDRPFVFAGVEVIAHAALATFVLGVRSGFFMYVPLLTVLTFLNPRASIRTKLWWSAAEAGAFMLLLGVAESVTPMAPPAAVTLRWLAVLNGALVVGTLGFLAHVTHEAVQAAERDLRRAMARLDELARTDPLTGLLNRRAMSEMLDVEAKRVDRNGRSFAVMVADLDDFKAINDAYGHPVGDHALRTIAQRLLGAVRAQDQVARWGGEEFLLLLPETDMPTALEVADRLRAAVADTALKAGDTELHVTGTIGVAVYRQGGSIHETVRAADRALYAGKSDGKDRVVKGEGAA
ncbi:MAG TPA: GGDEF domain-containing protein [Trueperaceae bacterium]|nr:GGDEF domain-containing protein [Trueperaceae bacterium]